MFFRNKKTNGFTLIELLIVVVIIGVLAGMVFVMIQGVIESARMARNKSFARSIQLQLALNEVGVWRFDDDPADGVHDASGWGNHGTLHIGAAGCPAEEGGTWQEGVFGKAICFDGADDFITVPASTSLTEAALGYTVEVWIKPQVDNDFWTRVVGRQGRNYNFWLGASNNPAGGYVHHRFRTTAYWNDGCPDTPLGSIPMNQWSHVVLVNDGSTCWTFINGEIKAGPRTFTPATLISNHTILNIGRNLDRNDIPGPAWNTFHGLIDEPRIYNQALEVYEIQDRYVKGIESLLARGLIDQEEFNNRMAEIEKNLAAK